MNRLKRIGAGALLLCMITVVTGAVYEKDNMVGINTADPLYTLDVNGSFSGGGKGIYRNTYGVPTAKSVPIFWKDEVSNLDSNFIYKVYANTIYTGTKNGCMYIVKYNGSAWEAKLVSQAGSNSNHPLISINENQIVVSHSHSRTYYISVSVESLYTREDATNWHVFGSDYMWTRDNDYLYYTDGNVGIGTVSPKAQLHLLDYTGSPTSPQLLIQNGIKTASDADAWIEFRHGDNGNAAKIVADRAGNYSGVNNNDSDLVFHTAENDIYSEKMRITSEGKVGIGTTNPSSALDVLGVAKFSNGTYGLKLSYSESGSNGFIDTIGTHPIGFRIKENEKMRIDTAGRVGIGTSTPGDTLDVNGYIKTTGGPKAYYGWGKISAPNMAETDLDLARPNLGTSKNVYRFNQHTGLSFSAHSYYGGIRFYNQGYSSSDSEGAYKPQFGASMVMALTDNKVGIGTASPSQLLHISSGTGSSASNRLAGVYIDSSGSTEATNKEYSFLRFSTPKYNINGTTLAEGLEIGVSEQDGLAYFNTNVNSGVTDYAMAITQSTGYVLVNNKLGIGTTTPTEKLDVNGTIKANSLKIDTGGATVQTYKYGLETVVNTTGGWARGIRFRNENDNKTAVFGGLHGMAYIATGFDPLVDETGYKSARLVIDTGGRVGIGTTTPREKLEVNGNALITGTVFSNDWILGADSWADFVFEEDYDLMPLKDLKLYVEENKHLPQIPSEKDVLENGVSIKDMQVNLLQKVEELTLYLFEQQSQIDQLMARNKELEDRVHTLEQ